MTNDVRAMPLPLCFVLMPFGRKRDPAGGPDIDFDRIYESAIRPAILDANLQPVRADGEVTGGVIHKAMFERLLLCEFAIADLTTANANVFYELGVRHAARPSTTLVLFAEQHPLPFDVNLLRGMPYHLGENNGFDDAAAAALRAGRAARQTEVRALAYDQPSADSPLVQLLQGYRFPEVAHLRTDVFRDQVEIAEGIRRELAAARVLKPAAAAEAAIVAVQERLAPFQTAETGALIDLYLSYRAVSAFDRMIALYERLPQVLRRTVLVREQLAFALNRKAAKQPANQREVLRDRAAHLLEEIIAERGANAETCGLLGRIFKDRWEEARSGDPAQARGLLRRAIKEYSRGFAADARDSYPGVNAVTLLDIEGSADSLAQRDRLTPVVRYAVEQRLGAGRPDYWDHATLLELAVLANDGKRADGHLEDAVASVREAWEPETTARNLGLLCQARRARGETVDWLEALIASLTAVAERRKGAS
jgi:hypothetical protein